MKEERQFDLYQEIRRMVNKKANRQLGPATDGDGNRIQRSEP